MPLARWHRVAWVLCLTACACARVAPRMAAGKEVGQQPAAAAADTLVIVLSTEDSCWVTDPLNRMGGPVDSLTSIPGFSREESFVGPEATIIHVVGPVPGVYGVRIAAGSTGVIVEAEVYAGHVRCEDHILIERDTSGTSEPVTCRFVYEKPEGGGPCVVRFLKK